MSDHKIQIKEILEELSPDVKLLSLSLVPSEGSLLFDFRVAATIDCNGTKSDLCIIGMKASSMAALADVVGAVALPKEAGTPCVLLIPYASPDKMAFIKKHSLNYIDEAGNAFIRVPGIYVNKQGFKQKRKEKLGGEVHNIFSDKATLVLRLLLDAQQLRVREACRVLTDKDINLSVGYISKVMNALVTQFYVKRDGNTFYLTNPKALLDDWTSDYRRRNKAQASGFFFPSTNIHELMERVAPALDMQYAFTGQAGASLVDPYASFDVIDLYVHEVEKARHALEAIGAKGVNRGANINLMEPYYKASSFYEARQVGGKWVVSDLQLYLDLRCNPIRGLEAAEHLYERKLGNRFKSNEESVL
jgi:hypothetical protein